MHSFSSRVVKIALSIPEGKVLTYGMIARAAGGGGQAARSITGILEKAYVAGEKNIPFHRIVYSDGRVWTNATHDAERKHLYKKEGIAISEKGKIENFRDTLFAL